ncbi:hypothetical protein ASE36_06030 [Rhizobium sp. Root274]|uniref:phage tail length tape measure family protein n=1 Tax=unclassified Rhizobium TaxID=2613769 RepID=UPI000713A72D|nr:MULTISPECIES: phage tail length tape measure family protein [unclassified Rhizobium]KQW31779.1 hypothetical protein ASC71_06035 [Rhizobium sp. Root1240]KRD33319.1 hypothetical protein ASE36_06030 [Rhizobium sp. Root274]
MAESADSGGLLVQIGVTQARMERELAKLVKDAAKSAQKMENDFAAANQNISKGAGAAFNGVSRGATAATGAVRNASFATANLAAQFNDIGVSLAGGQSPFLVMLQQGTQISQLFNQTGTSIRGFGSILAGAVTSVLNPFSLLTFAIIGAGGYAVQYFSSLTSGGEEANKVVEEQAKLIESVAKTWGDAVPALQAYVAALATAKNAADLLQASRTLADKQWTLARAEIEAVNVAFTDLKSQLASAGEETEIINDLNQAFQNLRAKVADGTATQADFTEIQDAMAAAIGSSGIPALNDFAAAFANLSQTIAGAITQARIFDQESLNALTVGKNGPPLGSLSPLFSEGGKLYSGEDFQPFGNAPTPTERPKIELTGLPDGYTPKKTGGGGRGANAFKDEVAGIRERTAALRESTAAQAAINPLVKDYGFAMEKAQAEQKLLADAQRAGMEITPQLREQISALATGYAEASSEAKRLSEEQKNIQKNAEEWANLEKDVFKGFLSDLKAGKSGAEALSNALNKLADKLLDMGTNALLGSFGSGAGAMGGGGGKGIFSAILGGIGKIFGFASGTPNTGGRRGQAVGVVHGQEAVIPLPAGGKVPVQINSPSASEMAKKSSRDEVEIVLIDDSGRMASIADQRIRTASGTIVSVASKSAFERVKGEMPKLMTDTKERFL